MVPGMAMTATAFMVVATDLMDHKEVGAGIVRYGADRRSGGVSVLEPTTGNVMRTVPLGTYSNAIAMDEPTDRVFVGSDDSTVSPLDARSGAFLGFVVVPHDTAPRCGRPAGHPARGAQREPVGSCMSAAVQALHIGLCPTDGTL
jgi:hypothetical protein